MFKKAGLVIGIYSVLVFSPAFAESDGSGCGLGKLILEGKSGAGANIASSIINGIYGNQTFAMSFGTMGCDTTTVVKNDRHEKKEFVAANMDNLSVDVAQGQGNYLAALAYIFKINEQDKDAFYSLTQTHYEKLFISNNPDNVLAELDSALASDNHLSKYIQ